LQTLHCKKLQITQSDMLLTMLNKTSIKRH